MAPVGVQIIFHEDKETGLAQVCSEIGVPFILSTASSSSIEEVAKANGNGPRWYQLYWPQDEEVTESLLKRAKENGYKVLVVTLDTWALAWRNATDYNTTYTPLEHKTQATSYCGDKAVLKQRGAFTVTHICQNSPPILSRLDPNCVPSTNASRCPRYCNNLYTC